MDTIFISEDSVPCTFIEPSVAALVRGSPLSGKRFLRKCSPADPSTLDDKCVVCMEELTEGPSVCNIVCQHVFHTECMELLTTNEIGKCPFCRVQWFYGQRKCTRIRAVHYTLRSLEVHGVLRLDYRYFARYRGDPEPMILRAVRIFGHCMQIQDIKGHGSKRAETYAALEEENAMKVASTSKEGHKLMVYLQRRLKDVTLEELSDCAINCRQQDGKKVMSMVERLLSRSVVKDALAAWEAGAGAPFKHAPTLRFIKKLTTWSLAACMKQLFALPVVLHVAIPDVNEEGIEIEENLNHTLTWTDFPGFQRPMTSWTDDRTRRARREEAEQSEAPSIRSFQGSDRVLQPVQPVVVRLAAPADIPIVVKNKQRDIDEIQGYSLWVPASPPALRAWDQADRTQDMVRSLLK